jgi:integrase
VTIVPRGGRFGVKVWDPGTRKYRWIGTYATEREAVLAERDAVPRPARNVPIVEQWCRIWLSDYARPAPATQRTYRYATEQIRQDVGKRRLDDIDRPLARRLANRWPRGTTRVARTMWADAARDGVTVANPFTNLRLKTPKGRKDLDALTEAEVIELADLAAAYHGDYGAEARAIILTLGFVGVRPGQLCVLRRSDLDVSIRELTVRFNLDGSGQEKAPKNGRPRIVTVPPPALDAIRRVPPALHDDYLFHTPRGRRLSKGTLHYLWRPVAAAWRAGGGRDIDLYDLRHAAATLYLERGLTPADVAVQLGHTDGGRLVQTLYGHPSEDLARDRLRLAFAEPRTQSGRGTERKAPGLATKFGALRPAVSTQSHA